MDSEFWLFIGKLATTCGVGLAGVGCLIAVSRQAKSGKTYCPLKGNVCGKENPGYFKKLFWGRLAIGLVLLAGAIVSLFLFV